MKKKNEFREYYYFPRSEEEPRTPCLIDLFFPLLSLLSHSANPVVYASNHTAKDLC